MLTIKNNEISLTRGDNAYFNVSITNKGDKPYKPQDGDEIILSVKRNILDENYAFQKRVPANEIITILPEDTKTLTCGRYYYDVQLNTNAGEIFTIIEKSIFYINQEVSM